MSTSQQLAQQNLNFAKALAYGQAHPELIGVPNSGAISQAQYDAAMGYQTQQATTVPKPTYTPTQQETPSTQPTTPLPSNPQNFNPVIQDNTGTWIQQGSTVTPSTQPNPNNPHLAPTVIGYEVTPPPSPPPQVKQPEMIEPTLQNILTNPVGVAGTLTQVYGHVFNKIPEGPLKETSNFFVGAAGEVTNQGTQIENALGGLAGKEQKPLPFTPQNKTQQLGMTAERIGEAASIAIVAPVVAPAIGIGAGAVIVGEVASVGINEGMSYIQTEKFLSPEQIAVSAAEGGVFQLVGGKAIQVAGKAIGGSIGGLMIGGSKAVPKATLLQKSLAFGGEASINAGLGAGIGTGAEYVETGKVTGQGAVQGAAYGLAFTGAGKVLGGSFGRINERFGVSEYIGKTKVGSKVSDIISNLNEKVNGVSGTGFVKANEILVEKTYGSTIKTNRITQIETEPIRVSHKTAEQFRATTPNKINMAGSETTKTFVSPMENEPNFILHPNEMAQVTPGGKVGSTGVRTGQVRISDNTPEIGKFGIKTPVDINKVIASESDMAVSNELLRIGQPKAADTYLKQNIETTQFEQTRQAQPFISAVKGEKIVQTKTLIGDMREVTDISKLGGLSKGMADVAFNTDAKATTKLMTGKGSVGPEGTKDSGSIMLTKEVEVIGRVPDNYFVSERTITGIQFEGTMKEPKLPIPKNAGQEPPKPTSFDSKLTPLQKEVQEFSQYYDIKTPTVKVKGEKNNASYGSTDNDIFMGKNFQTDIPTLQHEVGHTVHAQLSSSPEGVLKLKDMGLKPLQLSNIQEAEVTAWKLAAIKAKAYNQLDENFRAKGYKSLSTYGINEPQYIFQRITTQTKAGLATERTIEMMGEHPTASPHKFKQADVSYQPPKDIFQSKHPPKPNDILFKETVKSESGNIIENTLSDLGEPTNLPFKYEEGPYTIKQQSIGEKLHSGLNKFVSDKKTRPQIQPQYENPYTTEDYVSTKINDNFTKQQSKLKQGISIKEYNKVTSKNTFGEASFEGSFNKVEKKYEGYSKGSGTEKDIHTIQQLTQELPRTPLRMSPEKPRTVLLPKNILGVAPKTTGISANLFSKTTNTLGLAASTSSEKQGYNPFTKQPPKNYYTQQPQPQQEYEETTYFSRPDSGLRHPQQPSFMTQTYQHQPQMFNQQQTPTNPAIENSRTLLSARNVLDTPTKTGFDTNQAISQIPIFGTATTQVPKTEPKITPITIPKTPQRNNENNNRNTPAGLGLPFPSLGSKAMEFGGNSSGYPNFTGLRSVKRQYDILTAEEFLGY